MQLVPANFTAASVITGFHPPAVASAMQPAPANFAPTSIMSVFQPAVSFMANAACVAPVGYPNPGYPLSLLPAVSHQPFFPLASSSLEQRAVDAEREDPDTTCIEGSSEERAVDAEGEDTDTTCMEDSSGERDSRDNISNHGEMDDEENTNRIICDYFSDVDIKITERRTILDFFSEFVGMENMRENGKRNISNHGPNRDVSGSIREHCRPNEVEEQRVVHEEESSEESSSGSRKKLPPGA
ncbi:hypothetical protein ElyMa_000283700 [Elysia marginata]|uniref:Uncharacterized protein n=1 Tax=Elysia marginata TaxID=1093978 RepID=A0AAV4F890_9GAST|nr:hypothetical protein ElyMa_000283700 [Elysia marginata]